RGSPRWVVRDWRRGVSRSDGSSSSRRSFQEHGGHFGREEYLPRGHRDPPRWTSVRRAGGFFEQFSLARNGTVGGGFGCRGRTERTWGDIGGRHSGMQSPPSRAQKVTRLSRLARSVPPHRLDEAQARPFGRTRERAD